MKMNAIGQHLFEAMLKLEKFRELFEDRTLRGISEGLRAYRQAAGVSVDELADALDCTNAKILLMEDGWKNLNSIIVQIWINAVDKIVADKKRHKQRRKKDGRK